VGSGLLARIVSVSNCTLTMGPIDTCPARELRGPVTAVDTLNTRIAVMGSWISLAGLSDAMGPVLPIEVGDRVRVVVKREVNSRIPVATLIEPWLSDEDGLRGIVEEVFTGNGTPVYAFRALGVYVQLTSLTSIVPEEPEG
jgi:hypothetical protein